MPSKSSFRDPIHCAVELADSVRPEVEARLRESRDDLHVTARAVRHRTGRGMSRREFSDQYAQALVCGAATLALGDDVFRDPTVCDWLLSNTNPVWRSLLQECASLYGESDLVPYCVDAAAWHNLRESLAAAFADGFRPSSLAGRGFYFLEAFQQRSDARHRRRHGVFFTPQPIARYILAEVHETLRSMFGLEDGLADTASWRLLAARRRGLNIPPGVDAEAPFVRILDPAAGSGVFLAEAIRLVHRELSYKWSRLASSPSTRAAWWDAYVADRLLPRLYGLELMLPACVVATIALTQTLAETGFSFRRSARLRLELANSLTGPDANPLLGAHLGRETQSRTVIDEFRPGNRQPFTVLVGNPPFSGISRDRSAWMIELLRGREGHRRRWADYYEVDGQPLGERKTWLQDDYVKFMRLAHWIVESTGCGVVGLVTNHGYLDNPTFRGLRYQLLQTFARLSVLDLHGNRKKGERGPAGVPDENVFAIDQGTAIGIFCRPPESQPCRSVRHADLWGPAGQKLTALQTAAANRPGASNARQTLPWRRVIPQGPLYLFLPRDSDADEEYARGFRLADVMPRYVTAPVTARDRFVVAFTRQELLQRMAEFRDLSIPDAEIRRRYFQRTRSPNYAAGDTRGWKLPLARRRVADDPDWQDRIRPCWYRPFDRRLVYWVPWMIDWPRDELLQHLQLPGNLALIARRQMLPTQPRNFFWVTDALPLDGLLRSDNRGSEAVFPLFLESTEPADQTTRIANVHERLLERVSQRTGWRWMSCEAGDLQTSYGAVDLLRYVYALFFCTQYRTRYADGLLRDFPHIFVPRRPEVFAVLSHLGRRLTAVHLLHGSPEAVSATAETNWTLNAAPRMKPGYPKYSESRVYVNRDVWLDGVRPDVWSFTVGAHQVGRKWLRDRGGRELSSEDMETYARVVAAIRDTIRCVADIDALIEREGGWTDTFDSE